MGDQALQSMTGFGAARAAAAPFELSCDVRSVNGRALDVKMRLPAGLEALEATLRKQVAVHLTRGNVHLTITAEPAGGSTATRVDEAAFCAIAKSALALSQKTGLAPPTTDGVLAVRGVVGADGAGRVDVSLQPQISALVDNALAQLVTARSVEGRALAATIFEQIETIDALTRAAADDAASQPEAIHKRLSGQIARLLSDRSDGALDAQRVEAEAALLATRADITEEIDRLGAHVEAARALLEDGGPVGRKLDFLAQEFNREANTLCAKSASTELTRIGLELKSVIDRMREQVQNLQ